MISWELFMVFVQEYDSHRFRKIKSFKPDSRKVSLPSPVFVQVFISMGLRLTICAACASGGVVALLVGEEKTSGGWSVADSAASSKGGNRRGSREAEVWFSVNMCDYNQEVLSGQLLFTV
jgi:hypothetical protein